MEQIRKHFEKNFVITDYDWHIFSSKLVRREFKKKQLLLKEGQVENHLSYMEEGILRFYIQKQTSDLTFSFAFSNGFLSVYNSFLTQTPLSYPIETSTKTVLWQLTFEDLHAICRVTEIGNAIGRHASEDLILKKSQRELSLLNQAAQARYL